MSAHSAKTDVHSELIEAVGCLESFLLICLMDLPRMTSGSLGGVWTKSAEIDRIIAGLGNRPGYTLSNTENCHFIIAEKWLLVLGLVVWVDAVGSVLRNLSLNFCTSRSRTCHVVLDVGPLHYRRGLRKVQKLGRAGSSGITRNTSIVSN